ncbi:NADH-quinone oxidoreductase subunit C [Aromatoleum anaerobium]|uniref:NADH-quinone oxidoreductase subunit C n=1 Tax=Aromatoleum anaerobium TaxID=182180 RepID=A0ABX1PH07_9RHOO|nr:NADH-quinone oxidoreductase subunit C [Aromatoleum anaerobium]MCK0508888.1 NADH-quinone oxidoreductase subunit C [Aromatoleum anaerobium]
MSSKLERLSSSLQNILGAKVRSVVVDRGEVTLEVAAADYLPVAQLLRDHRDLRFEELVDLTGLDYSAYGNGVWAGRRFAVAVHLLSITHNWRIRLRAFADDDAFPVLESLVGVWPGVNWYEREAFDLYGIMFAGHPDLRRILTDYGFVGYPFRKDFPVSGYVEMRYDPEQGRVVYQPVTIEPRENTPRIVREENYGDVGNG